MAMPSAMPTATPTVSTTAPCEEKACETAHGCFCLKQWFYEGKSMNGCEQTSDHPSAWCYVFNPSACNGANLDQSDEDFPVAWDTCGDTGTTTPTETPTDALTPCKEKACETTHGCFCLKQWSYNGKSMSGCEDTSNGPSAWCYVFNPSACTG